MISGRARLYAQRKADMMFRVDPATGRPIPEQCFDRARMTALLAKVYQEGMDAR